jgi:acyl-[acyl-carrier-protein]-phospholipid O-acyltransferase/long-chain-fatty-acid--[acyl-carrier-protein] ligase
VSALALLGRRRFWPLFATQFLGAFNDNLFRSGMLFLIAFRLSHGTGGAIAASLTGGVFILPYFLFSSLSGELADRIDKARVARGVKLAEVAIMLVGAAGLLLPSQGLLYLALFAMGTHSTVFGPVKYAILPQHLAAGELVAGTALVEAGTFLAILAGQIAGGLMPTPWATGAMVVVAAAGLAASLAIPTAPPLGIAPPPDRNLARGTWTMLRSAWREPVLRQATIGISWFFALGAVLTQQFVPLVASLGATPAVAAYMLALFSVGVAVGSLLAGRVMRGRVTARTVFPAALAIAVLTADIARTIAGLRPVPGGGIGIARFVAMPGATHLSLDLVALAIAAGLYVVPLYALLQTEPEPTARARAVAANNVANAAMMVLVTILSLVVLRAGLGLPGLFAVLSVAGLAAAAAAWRLRRV